MSISQRERTSETQRVTDEAATPSDPAPIPATQVESERGRIVGAWALSGESCTGFASVIYMQDGRWDTPGGGGSWSITGSTLTNVTRTLVQHGERHAVASPHISHFELLSITPDALRLRYPDGSVKTLVRCG